jgi:hypothetical protein
MRITEDRYSQHRRSLDLAWRLIKHEARTRTISQWTQLSGHRIRQLYKSYSSKQHKRVTRHRGMSPYKLETILSSPQLRCEGALLAAICRSLRVLPHERLTDPERALPSVERGELLCEAYEWFTFDVPGTRLTLEHGLLLINQLVRGELVRLGACRTCRGVILLDCLSTGRLQCVFCCTRLDNIEPKPVQHVPAEFSCHSRVGLVVGGERKAADCQGERTHVNSGQSIPHQLSCLDECEDLRSTSGRNVKRLAERAEVHVAPDHVAARPSLNDEGVCPNLGLFD